MQKIVCGICLVLLLAGNALAADKASPLKSEKAKLSYAMGLDLGNYFKSLGEDFDLKVLQKGVEDAYTGKKPLMTPEEAAEVQKKFAARQQERQIRETVAMVQKNRAAAEKFLAENKKKPGVITTKSGLQYKVIKKGNGPKPGPNDTVKVHYKGTLLDGTEFDSSYKRNEPAQFKVGQVIPGWQEALQLMPVGSTFELYLPPDLAYGDRGAPPVIEPGSMLIFQVELLDLPDKQKKEAKKDKAKKKKKPAIEGC
jgi:FKBP-type peptidyl-prolyl cis-trans isomerase